MYLKSLALAAAAAIVTVSAQNTDPSSSAPTLVQLLQSTPELQNLTAVLGQFPGLARALINSTKELTILAPDNDAFAAFLKGPGAALAARNETGLIEGIIEYHVLAGLYPSSKFSDTPAFLSSVLGLPIFTNVTGGQVVEVVKNGSDVEAISGLKAESTVVKADLAYKGGVVHIINSVLTLPGRISRTAAAAGLTILVEALAKTGLLTAVDETPDVTVFAPTNAAFKAAAGALGKLDAKDLATVLKAHVVAGAVEYSSKLTDGLILQSLSGGKIEITIKDGSVFANGVKVITPDVLVANGVVHVIDGILNPPPTSATGKPVGGIAAGNGTGSASPSGTVATTATTAAPTSSPIAPYVPNAAPAIQASWTGLAALAMGLIYLNA